jgi:hypothetical protein
VLLTAFLLTVLVDLTVGVAAEKFRETMTQLGDEPKALILRMRNVPAMDDALNVARVRLGLEPVKRPAFAVPTVRRQDRRRQPREAS